MMLARKRFSPKKNSESDTDLEGTSLDEAGPKDGKGKEEGKGKAGKGKGKEGKWRKEG